MAKGSVYDQARNLKNKSRRAIEASEKKSDKGGEFLHPSSSKSGGRKSPKATSMAPRDGGKRKSYGRRLPETAAEERKRKSGK